MKNEFDVELLKCLSWLEYICTGKELRHDTRTSALCSDGMVEYVKGMNELGASGDFERARPDFFKTWEYYRELRSISMQQAIETYGFIPS